MRGQIENAKRCPDGGSDHRGNQDVPGNWKPATEDVDARARHADRLNREREVAADGGGLAEDEYQHRKSDGAATHGRRSCDVRADRHRDRHGPVLNRRREMSTADDHYSQERVENNDPDQERPRKKGVAFRRFVVGHGGSSEVTSGRLREPACQERS